MVLVFRFEAQFTIYLYSSRRLMTCKVLFYGLFFSGCSCLHPTFSCGESWWGEMPALWHQVWSKGCIIDHGGVKGRQMDAMSPVGPSLQVYCISTHPECHTSWPCLWGDAESSQGSARISGPITTTTKLLQHVKQATAGGPIQTDNRRSIPVYWPSSTQKASHVHNKKSKPSSLGPVFELPFPIVKTLEDDSLEVHVGDYSSCKPHLSTSHWNNCKLACMSPGAILGVKPALDRPKSK